MAAESTLPTKEIGFSSTIWSFKNAELPSEKTYILFHGFPAQIGNRNQDIALAIHQATGSDVYMLHYKGLEPSDPQFSFVYSVEESEIFIAELLKKYNYKKINIIGHSWGGLVAINVAATIDKKLDQLILLNPFNTFPEKPVLEYITDEVGKSYPHIFTGLSKTNIMLDLEVAQNQNNPKLFVQDIQAESIVVIQSIEDNEVPVETTRSFIQHIPKAKYIEIDSNHDLSINREMVLKLILDNLR